MQDSLSGRILWTVAYVGLGIFWSVVALQQFGTAWATALGDTHSNESSDYDAVY